MTFPIESAAAAAVADDELQALLSRVYVDEGFTEPSMAAVALAPSAVRARGEILFARSPADQKLIGMVIFVTPTSAARRLAHSDEAELHLLAVSPESRHLGVGRALVDAVIAKAKEQAYDAVVLWTQPSMLAAHRLYKKAGFRRIPERDFQNNGRDYMALARVI